MISVLDGLPPVIVPRNPAMPFIYVQGELAFEQPESAKPALVHALVAIEVAARKVAGHRCAVSGAVIASRNPTPLNLYNCGANFRHREPLGALLAPVHVPAAVSPPGKSPVLSGAESIAMFA